MNKKSNPTQRRISEARCRWCDRPLGKLHTPTCPMPGTVVEFDLSEKPEALHQDKGDQDAG